MQISHKFRNWRRVVWRTEKLILCTKPGHPSVLFLRRRCRGLLRESQLVHTVHKIHITRLKS